MTFDQILNTKVPSEYVGLPLLDISFKRTDRMDLERNISKHSPYPYTLLAFLDDNYCIVFSGDGEWIDIPKSRSDSKLYVSTYSKIYYGASYANMDVIGTLLREYLECKGIHACTYPGQEYWDKIDYYVGGIHGAHMIGRIRIDEQGRYDYVIYNLFDKSAQLISLTDAQYLKLVYLQMKAFGMKSTMIEIHGKIGSMSEEGIYFPSDHDVCFISDNSKEMSYSMIAINQNGKWGFIDSDNRIIVPAQYDYTQNGARLFEINRENIECAKVVVDGKFGLVDSDGNLFVECVYDSIGDDKSGLVFINGMALVCKDFKYGFINKEGKLVINCIYDLADDYFSDFDSNFNNAGIVVLKLNGSIVFVDKSGSIVKTASWIKESFYRLYPYEGDVARARVGKKWGLINKYGEWITPLMFDRIYAFWSNITQAKMNGKFGVVNSVGQWVISPDYDSISLYNDYIKATLESDSFYFNLAGEQIPGPIFNDEKQEFSEGLIKVKLNSKWGFKDASGNWVIKPQYDEAGDFYHGWASVSLNGISTHIDKFGKSRSREGLAIAYSVREDSYGLFGFIDESNSWIIKPTHTNVGYFFEGLAKAEENGKWGFIDKCGKWVIQPKYEDVGNFHNGVVSVLYNDVCQWINSKGDLVR